MDERRLEIKVGGLVLAALAGVLGLLYLMGELSLDGGRPEIRRRSTVPLPDALMPEGSRDYDITPDGERILMIVPADEPGLENARPQIHVVLNWFEELKTRAPVR